MSPYQNQNSIKGFMNHEWFCVRTIIKNHTQTYLGDGSRDIRIIIIVGGLEYGARLRKGIVVEVWEFHVLHSKDYRFTSWAPLFWLPSAFAHTCGIMWDCDLPALLPPSKSSRWLAIVLSGNKWWWVWQDNVRIV